MTQITAYLTFNGNCREAMQFYQSCLGGELLLQTIGESPHSKKLPARMKEHIVHATLTNGAITIMASDMVADQGFIKGNTVSLMLNCSSEKEIRNYYRKLSAFGHATHPLKASFWGALSGDLTDQFGTNWILYFEHANRTEESVANQR